MKIYALSASATPLCHSVSGSLLWLILQQSRRRSGKMKQSYLVHYRKSHRAYKIVLVTLTLVLLLIPLSVPNISLKLEPIQKADLLRIISQNHPNPKLVEAIIQVESNWDGKAVSNKGAIGLMQVMPSSARQFVTLKHLDLTCPVENIKAGTTILKHYQKTSPNLRVALRKYSGGAAGYYEKVTRRMKG
jgi:hypothetical protein